MFNLMFTCYKKILRWRDASCLGNSQFISLDVWCFRSVCSSVQAVLFESLVHVLDIRYAVFIIIDYATTKTKLFYALSFILTWCFVDAE